MPLFSRKKKGSALAQPRTVLDRVAQLVRANAHAALDAAEDPEKMLDQFVRDYTASIQDAETAVVETIGHLRLMEQDRRDATQKHADWGRKALAASSQADRLRAAGRDRKADEADRLAATALRKQVDVERRVAGLDPQIARQNDVAEQLKGGLAVMREKLSELKDKRHELLARAHAVEAQGRVVDAVSALNAGDPVSEISRYEEGVRGREALVQGRAEVAAASLESRFDEMESLGELAVAEDRLAALKRGESASLPALSMEARTEDR